MHILILNHYAGSPSYGMEFRPYYLAQEWIKLGHQVTIVAANNSHIRRINPEPKGNIWEENVDGIRYIWLKSRPYAGNGVGRMLNMLDYIRGLYKNMKGLAALKPDVVVASSTYPLDNYPAYKLAKKTGAQFIYEVHDLWPLGPQLLGGYSKWHPFIVVMQAAENFAYKHVDKVVSILPCAEEHMKEHGLTAGKFYHVPNGVYLPEVQNAEPLSEEFVNQLPKDKKIIGYCGTLGRANALHNLVEVARMVKDSNPDLFFAIVGKGPEKDNLNALIKKYGLDNIRIYDAIPKPQVQSFLQLSSIIIIIIIWSDSDLYKYGISPNKIFDYMYAGKPVLQSVRAGNDIPRDSGCGITCDTKPEEIAQTLKKMLALPQAERDEMGKKGHDYVMQNHTYEVLAKRFLEAIEHK